MCTCTLPHVHIASRAREAMCTAERVFIKSAQEKMQIVWRFQFACFSHFLVVSHIFLWWQRKWIIIIWAKYLMFPLFEWEHKQMRHQRFIARTITRRPLPTAGPGPAAGTEPAQGSDHHRVYTHTHTHTHTHTDHQCSHTLCPAIHAHAAPHLWKCHCSGCCHHLCN